MVKARAKWVKNFLTSGPSFYASLAYDMKGHARKLILYTDGASRGNPGPASIGVVIKDESGEPVWEKGETLGTQTNNYAEYTALIRGLEKLAALGAHEVEIRTD